MISDVSDNVGKGMQVMAPRMAASVCCSLVLLMFLFVFSFIKKCFSDQFH